MKLDERFYQRYFFCTFDTYKRGTCSDIYCIKMRMFWGSIKWSELKAIIYIIISIYTTNFETFYKFLPKIPKFLVYFPIFIGCCHKWKWNLHYVSLQFELISRGMSLSHPISEKWMIQHFHKYMNKTIWTVKTTQNSLYILKSNRNQIVYSSVWVSDFVLAETIELTKNYFNAKSKYKENK